MKGFTMSTIVDTSIFEDAKKDVEEILSGYECETYRLRSNRTDENKNVIFDHAELYIVDFQAIKRLKEIDTLLSMEYGQYDELNKNKSDAKRKPRSIKDLYSLESIVKVVDFEKPSNRYQISISERWKQINDEENVKNKLEAELIKHENKIFKRIQDKMDIKKLTPEIRADINKRVSDELREQKKYYQYIVDNFDELDVRISGYFERIEVAVLYWYVKNTRQKDLGLRKTVPNVLWFEDAEVTMNNRSDNELQEYFKKATRAFGNVFFAPKDENNQKPRRKTHKGKSDE